jgi:hypothetical protein
MSSARHSRIASVSPVAPHAPGVGEAGVHAYPRDLARLVRERWAQMEASAEGPLSNLRAARIGLPAPATLERLLSVCYQASLLHEEGRPVTFRLALAEPETFDAAAGPPTGLHRLVFAQSRLFDEHELRRLAPAAVFQRSLIGVHLDAGVLKVWGLIHSGPRWLQAVRGGRRLEQSIPPVLMIAVTGPGRVLVSKGARTLAGLAGGTLGNVATDVFEAPWLASCFGDLGVRRRAERASTFEEATPPGNAREEEAFAKKLAAHVMRRVVATVRGARHGGTLIVLPAQSAAKLCSDNRCLTVKYPFLDEEPRRRILSLTLEIIRRLAAPRARRRFRAEDQLSWAEYEASGNPRLAALDEALFEVAHLVATLTNVDGAVVMTDELEILGFGTEISGALPEVHSVDRSLDLEGTHRVPERTDRVGTRHRSAYRLCQELHEALVIVVSQDGGVRFIRWQDERVTYFDQIATGPWEV